MQGLNFGCRVGLGFGLGSGLRILGLKFKVSIKVLGFTDQGLWFHRERRYAVGVGRLRRKEMVTEVGKRRLMQKAFGRWHQKD